MPIEAIVLGPGGGRRAVVGSTAGVATAESLVKATAADTLGAYTLRENAIAAGQPPVRLHIHHRMEEAFFILEGQLSFQVGQDSLLAPAGSFVLVPRGLTHTFSNPNASPARTLVLFSPPGFERYFEELAELRLDSPTGEVAAVTLAALAARYDTEYFDLPART